MRNNCILTNFQILASSKIKKKKKWWMMMMILIENSVDAVDSGEQQDQWTNVVEL